MTLDSRLTAAMNQPPLSNASHMTLHFATTLLSDGNYIPITLVDRSYL